MPSHPRKIRFLRFALLALLFGAASTVMISWITAGYSTPWTSASTVVRQALDNDRRWTVTSADVFGAMALHSQHTFGRTSWSPQQALGPPNARPGSDDVMAWASSSTDAMREWLEVEFDKEYDAASVEIHETHCPGAVDKITVPSTSGGEVTIWQGADPTPPGTSAGVSTMTLNTKLPIKRLRIHLDSPNVPGWNEIDAVGLIDKAGVKHWAVRASASSFYGDRNSSGLGNSYLTPSELAAAIEPFGWLGQLPEPMAAGNIASDERMVLAYGWPFLAMWREEKPATPSGVGITGSYSIYISGFSLPTSGTIPTPATIGRVPYRPMFWGFALNTLIYAAFGTAAFWAMVRPRQFVAELSRMKRGCCISCGYQLGYDFKAGCPNCGWRRTDDFPPSV